MLRLAISALLLTLGLLLPGNGFAQCDPNQALTISQGSRFRVDVHRLSPEPCKWLDLIKPLMETYRREFPGVEAIATHDETGFLFEFDIRPVSRFSFPTGKKVSNDLGQTLELKDTGYGLFLKASYLEPALSSKRKPKEKIWENYLFYDLPSPYRKLGTLPAERFANKLDALIHSFFAESDPSASPILEKPEEDSADPVFSRRDPRVSLTLVSRALESGWPRLPIEEAPYYAILIKEMVDYFQSSKGNLPKGVVKMNIQMGQSCIGHTWQTTGIDDRHAPSLIFPCLGISQPAIFFYFEVYNLDGDRVLWSTQLGPEPLVDNAVLGYFDTIPLPYKPGLFDVLMKRIRSEIDDSLRGKARKTKKFKPPPWDVGP